SILPLMSEAHTEENKSTQASTTGGPHNNNVDAVTVSDSDVVVAESIVEIEPAKKNKKPLYIAGAVLLVAAIAGSIYWLYARQFEYTDDAFIEGEIVQISPKIVAYVDKVLVKENQYVKKGELLVELNSDELRAKLESAQSQLRAAESRRTRAEAQTNLTRVSTNATQVQARSNVQTARNFVTQSGLTAEARRAEIRQAESAVKTANANLAKAKAQIPQAESSLRLAQNEYSRDLDLFNFGSVSRRTLDHSENALQRAKAELNTTQNQVTAAASEVDEAEAKVATAQNNYKESVAKIQSSESEVDESMGRLKGASSAPQQIAVDQSEVGLADAGIEEAEASIRAVELELASTRIYAPQDGYVTRKNVREGQLVQPGAALMSISQTDIWIVANFKETQIERMSIGQTVEIKVDAYPGKVFRGTVDSFQAGTGSAFSVLPSQNVSGNFLKVVQRVPVKIIFTEKPENVHLLVPGMSVQPKVRVL
ncbi:MAG: HlyD family secretion protein, partial [Pyrinomonadaceae bacterium]